MPDALDDLAVIISKGLNEKSPDLLASVKALFGTRYYQNDWKSDDGVRNRYRWANTVFRLAPCCTRTTRLRVRTAALVSPGFRRPKAA